MSTSSHPSLAKGRITFAEYKQTANTAVIILRASPTSPVNLKQLTDLVADTLPNIMHKLVGGLSRRMVLQDLVLICAPADLITSIAPEETYAMSDHMAEDELNSRAVRIYPPFDPGG